MKTKEPRVQHARCAGLLQPLAGGRFGKRRGRRLIPAFLLMGVLVPASAFAQEGQQDPAVGAVNPAHRVSDSPALQLPADMKNWPAAVPTANANRGIAEDPGALEIYDVATKEVVRVPSAEQKGRVRAPAVQVAPPYTGLLDPGVISRSVIGVDDRVRITPTTSYPWRTITKLYITAADNSGWICSGSIIGRADGNGFHVLTAGHCVYMHDHGGWVSSIKVIPGLDDTYMPYHYAWAGGLTTWTGWTDDANHQWDMAVIRLDRCIGNHTGWMGRVTAGSGHSMYEGPLHCAGYPGDLCSTCLWYDGDYGNFANEHNHWYWMDTAGGMSGMPVWLFIGSSRYIATVHAYGVDGTGSNHGTRLCQAKYDDIISIMDDAPKCINKADLIDDGDDWSGFDPVKVTAGAPFDAWCDVRNVGTASSGGFSVSFYASTNTIISAFDHLIGTVSVGSINPFSWASADWSGPFPGTIPPGTYYVGWIIDSGGVVDEFDESNNTAYKASPQLVVNEITGACCFPDYCEDGMDYDTCTSDGGVYMGDGTDCGSVTCPSTTGACCFCDYCEPGMDFDTCVSDGGSYMGDGTDCANVNCPAPTGACCASAQCTQGGTCETGFPPCGGIFDCMCFKTSDGGQACEYGSTGCSGLVPCPGGMGDCPAGEVCFVDTCCGGPVCSTPGCDAGEAASEPVDGPTIGGTDGISDRGGSPSECMELTRTVCARLDGLYQGDCTYCANTICPSTIGACCDESTGICQDYVSSADCMGLQYTWYQGLLCMDTAVSCEPPPPTGACCYGTTCEDLTEAACRDLSGTWLGSNIRCSQTRQACCSYEDGSCGYLDPVCCEAFQGAPQGTQTHCDWRKEACCLYDGACRDVIPLCCDDINGWPSPIGEPVCLQDNDGDGVDDAC
ncbi:MAG: trypsin-like serine peptidase, partial [Planctomycetota bacterium]